MGLKVTFKDQLVLVTGSTRGIGQAIAKEIAVCGGNLILTGTGPERPDWVVEHATISATQTINYRQLDFTAKDWIDRLDKIINEYPDIDVCINNAGINIISDIRDVRVEDLRNVLEVNLVAPAIITSRLASSMAARNYGRIVNIASIFGVDSWAKRSSYSASKAGLIGQTRAVALDLAADGVLVNAVCPGFTATDLTKRVLGEQGMAEIADRIPLGRLAAPTDIVAPVLFLASDLNTYITGQILVVDGGYSVS